jgi:hypothetical protein
MFQVFYMFQRYVASVLYGCYKSKLRCCIYCNCYTRARILQAYVPNVSCVFRRMLQVCLLDVAYVSHIYCKFFIWMLHMFCNGFSSVLRCFCKCFRRMFEVFHLSSNVCCKYIYWMFQKHMLQWCRWLDGRPTAGLRLLPRTTGLALSSPLPPLPSLLFPFLPFPSLHLAAIVRARCRRGVRQRWSGMGREAGPWCQG